jgi:hypothetical protein
MAKRARDCVVWCVISCTGIIMPTLISFTRRGCMEKFDENTSPAYHWRTYWRRKRGFRIGRIKLTEAK